MRLFVAVRIPEPLLRRVIAVQEEFRKIGADVRWVSPESVHLTLAFLGEIDETIISGHQHQVGEDRMGVVREIGVGGWHEGSRHEGEPGLLDPLRRKNEMVHQ